MKADERPFIGDLAAVFPKVFNTRSIQGKDLYFFRDHNEFGRKIAKLQINTLCQTFFSLKKEARGRSENQAGA